MENIKTKSFEEIWSRIVSLQGEKFFTVRGIPFDYEVKGDKLYPTHIAFGHATKDGFEKAYAMKTLIGPGQLKAEDIFGPSYVFAILTDPRVRNF